MITQKDIEKLVGEIFRWASTNKVGHDFGVYYGDKVKQWTYDVKAHKYRKELKSGINPLDYCEWFDECFIGGMWYDGEVYECINGYARETAYYRLEKLLERYGLYLEHCDSCHCAFCPMDSLDDFEFVRFHKEKPVWLYQSKDAPDDAIRQVMERQLKLATEIGDKGACTIGEHFEFRYKGTLYRMVMQTPYQGEWSWRETIPEVRRLLEECGATEIRVDYGRLD